MGDLHAKTYVDHRCDVRTALERLENKRKVVHHHADDTWGLPPVVAGTG